MDYRFAPGYFINSENNHKQRSRQPRRAGCMRYAKEVIADDAPAILLAYPLPTYPSDPGRVKPAMRLRNCSGGIKSTKRKSERS